MARTALVTGGTRGIGAEIAKRLKEAGYTVAATYAHNKERAKAFSEETGIHVYKWDVASFEETEAGIKQVQADLGAVEILVNNAGITADGFLHKMTAEQWHSVVDTNLASCFNSCRAVVPGMRDRKFGRIINISSINGLKGQMGQTNYAASKAGMRGFTKSLALENAFKGITVNAIAPGYIATEMVNDIQPEIVEKIKEGIPVGRLGEPAEIARAVVFLAADDSGFITGETLNINGGQYMA